MGLSRNNNAVEESEQWLLDNDNSAPILDDHMNVDLVKDHHQHQGLVIDDHVMTPQEALAPLNVHENGMLNNEEGPF